MADDPWAEYAHLLSASWSRRGKLQRACLAVMREHQRDGALPTSVRFVFYELEQRGIISKQRRNRDGTASRRRSDTDVSEALTHLREKGLVRWSWIVDETRQLDTWVYGKSIAEAIRAEVDGARLDCWGGQAPPLILTESRSLAGVLSRVASEYLCPIAATNGQVGGFLHTDIAPALWRGAAVLYLGDLDLAGGDIEDNTRRVLTSLVRREIDWQRVAITAKQAEGIAPIVKADSRYTGTYVHEAWETEALGQVAVVALLRAALDARLPQPLEDVQEREVEQREAILAFLDEFDPGEDKA